MAISQNELNQQLKSADIDVSATELHGLLSGMICGGVTEQNWLPLLYQFTNNNHAYPISLVQSVNGLYEHILKQLASIDSFNFELGIVDDENVFDRADSLSEWANQFLFGLGLIQPYLDKEKGEIGEAIADLQDICQLGYDESDDKEEMAEAVEEIIEYLRTVSMLLYTYFNEDKQKSQPVLH